jgi:hypothetical protein
MTMPNERFRALRWGREFLRDLPGDLQVPAALRERAAMISPRYPSDQLLRELIAARTCGLPPEIATPLGEAATLLHIGLPKISWSGREETLRQRRRVCRHFPSLGEVLHQLDFWSYARRAPTANWMGSIADWMLPDE